MNVLTVINIINNKRKTSFEKRNRRSTTKLEKYLIARTHDEIKTSPDVASVQQKRLVGPNVRNID